MVLVGVISWRSDVYYSGGLDPVVAAKAALSLVALALAFLALSETPIRRPVGARTVSLIAVYLVVSMLGAWATGSLMSSAVLSTRVVIIGLVVILVMVAYPMADVVETLLTAMVVVGLFCSITGVGSVLGGGRLTGGLFPINSNQIALLFGPPTIALVWRLLRGAGTRLDLVGVLVFSGLTWLTGSRTGLLALLVAIVVLVLQARPLPVGAFLACIAAVPVIAYLVISTGLVSSYFERGDAASVTTLSSRTIAWDAAFNTPKDFWQQWFGGGLAVKTVGVSGTYWDTQVLDSSWVSAFVQAGGIGIVLLGLWALTTLVAAFRMQPPWRALWTGVVVYLLVRSFLSSGMIDAHVLFVVMFVASVATERVSRQVDDGVLPARVRGTAYAAGG
jgi:O-antigen ligase/polysaccharide polymerase Wzy-like membrane protein